MKNIQQLLESVEHEGLRTVLIDTYSHVNDEFMNKPAAVKHHHKEQGGMGRHVMEVMNIALETYDQHPDWYECSRDDVIVVAFCHDFDKLGRYVALAANHWKRQKKYGGAEFEYAEDKVKLHESAETVMTCAKLGIPMNPMRVNAICYHHGGWADGKPSTGLMTPLAVLIHTADILSTKIFGQKQE